MTRKKTILVVDINHWDREQLARTDFNWRDKYEPLLYEYDPEWCNPNFDAIEFIRHTVKKFRGMRLGGVASSGDYPGCIVASVIAKERRLPAPTPQSVLACSHKYYSRIMQREAVPDATPRTWLINPAKVKREDLGMDFPVFLKPVKSWSSVLARRVDCFDELKAFLSQPAVRRFKTRYLRSFNRLVKAYTTFKANGDYFLAEQVCRGKQVTVEGFVYEGAVEIIGIVDSVMYPGTMSFARFECPSGLPAAVQARMKQVAARVMRHAGFNNGLFNIEMFYDARRDQIRIIEINPRMVGQFADLMEKVHGTNTYEILMALAAGERPRVKQFAGEYKIAASFVPRAFGDHRVERMPDREQIEAIKRSYPGTVVHTFYKTGERMSDYEDMDDVASYSYAMINLGAQDRAELMAKYRQVKKRLAISLADVEGSD